MTQRAGALAEDRQDAVAYYAAPASTMSFRGRGVHYFSGRIRSPFAGLGVRAADHSNRLALDDDKTSATVEPERRRIVFRNSGTYPDTTVWGDVIFLAHGVTRTGKPTPLSLHLKLLKKGSVFSSDLHRHLRVSEDIVSAEVEPYTVVFDDGTTERTLLTPQSALLTICKPSLGTRIVKALMDTQDKLAGVAQDPTQPGYRVADLCLGFKVLGLKKSLVRAELVSLTGQPKSPARGQALADTLAQGAWELRLTALSDKWLTPVVQRDLFLFGIEDLEVLRPVRKRGLLTGETMAFRFERGQGWVRLGDVVQELPGATDVARAYLEYHLLGGLLAEHAERRLGLGNLA